ncbi:MAG TPA: tRNA pseudouridine(55) synthase TruB [Polyangiaceae bacterium]
MTRGPIPHGLLVVDKPRGPTSHDVVMRIRRALRLREVGHAGTLDPMASGVLVVALGEATKLVPWLTGHDKAYVATIALGVETDTLDAEGRETAREQVSGSLSLALAETRPGGAVPPLLAAALASEQMRTTQIPPAFSAVKTNGKRAYAMARRGEAPVLEARPVRVDRLDLLACTADPPSLSVGLDVAKGYYVRALARDLSLSLGTVGHLTSLRRVRSGSFSCDEAISPDASPDALLARLQPIHLAAARTLPVSTLTDAGADHARHGRRVEPGEIATPGPGPSAWLDARGLLVAVGETDAGGCGRVLRGFADVTAAGG